MLRNRRGGRNGEGDHLHSALADVAPRSAAPARTTISASDAAWLAAVPTAALTVLTVLLLGPWVGRTLLAPDQVRFWSLFLDEVRPEPVEDGRVLVALAGPLLLVGVTFALTRVRWRGTPATLGVVVAAVQTALVGFAALSVAQQQWHVLGALYPARPIVDQPHFFEPATLLVAAIGTAAVAAFVADGSRWAALTRRTRETPRRRIAAALIAVTAIGVWLLHAAYTEATIGGAHLQVLYHVQFTLDETYAVLDGRSPLVDFAAQYGSLWAYAFAAVMSVVGTSLGVWIVLALSATGAGMLAIFAVLRRVTGSALRGLALFLPVLATSFFMVEGPPQDRYTYGNYFGTFPLRYAGPSIVAWLVARHLGGARPRRAWPLFLAAGIVVLNNADVGVAALGATTAALLWSGGRPTRGSVARLLAAGAGGLTAAFALGSLVTLARAGSLPHVGLLLRFSRLFGVDGFGEFPMPTIGLHLVVYATFAGALAVATVEALRGSADRTATGMLAWSAVFGLGASVYFAGRSTPENLVALFFPWSFALALLLVPALRALAAEKRRRPPIGAIACVFGFLVMACSLAQTPTPWEQLERLGRTGAPVAAAPTGQRFVAVHTRRGEHVAILLLLGHRMGVQLGLENVAPYANDLSMPAAEQLDETLAALRESGGHKLFVFASDTRADERRALKRAGFHELARDREEDTALWSDAG